MFLLFLSLTNIKIKYLIKQIKMQDILIFI